LRVVAGVAFLLAPLENPHDCVPLLLRNTMIFFAENLMLADLLDQNTTTNFSPLIHVCIHSPTSESEHFGTERFWLPSLCILGSFLLKAVEQRINDPRVGGSSPSSATS